VPTNISQGEIIDCLAIGVFGGVEFQFVLRSILFVSRLFDTGDHQKHGKSSHYEPFH
jgi:hypothetical protein